MPKHLTVGLPSEAEWEKAARGGQTIPEKPVIRAIDAISEQPDQSMLSKTNSKGVFPWGDHADENRSNVKESGIGSTSAVGCFPNGQSPYGCEEMSGNAWEWTLSWYDDPTDEPRLDWQKIPQITKSDRIILKGGSFVSEKDRSRCASRYWVNPCINWRRNYGFRVLLSPFSSDL